MKMLKKSALSVAVAAALGATAAQADNSFVDDSSLSFTYKNYFWENDVSSSNDSEEWVQALVADYQSGYFADVIGIDIQAGFANDINSKTQGDGYPSNPSNVPVGDNGNVNDIAGFQQAYLKAKFGDDDLSLYGTYGVKKRGLETYGDSGSRILNSSSYGVDLAANVYGVDLYATRLTGASARNASTFKHDLENENGEKIDDIKIFGAGYEISGLSLVAEQANSKDYLKKSFAKVGYSFDVADNMSVDLDARYGKVKEDGRLYGDDGYKSSYTNYNATLSFGNAYVGLGYNKTKDGDYNNALYDGDHGTYNSSLDQWEGYNYEDEKAFLFSAGYDFSDHVPGLSVDVWYANGEDAKDIDNFKQKELGAYVNYDFSGKLEGLSLAWYHAAYRTSGTSTDPNRDDLLGALYDADINRVYLTYTYEVF
ncbi:OprD family outer membrane porin [Kistimonas asteriae]|uniref:OprD family outer membrane porin n=1 Tax=Kistimonas asteriae TaxID=517724 RepID=UPI001BAD90AD|nr:OprD family outer membrane porin [Kistimonas asteriae]